MASAKSTVRLCASVCSRASRLEHPPRVSRSAAWKTSRRLLSTSANRLQDNGQGSRNRGDATDDVELELKQLKRMPGNLTTDEVKTMHDVSLSKGFDNPNDYVDNLLDSHRALRLDDAALVTKFKALEKTKKVGRDSVWIDTEDPEGMFEIPSEPWDENDMPDMAHAKLDEVREMRQYARLAVWEMPLLAKLAKPFEPPSENQPLRWRYTTYMGETHPAEKKVVVQFAPDDLKLTPAQTLKLKKIAGPRYNPETEMIKMGCDNYEYQAQNKRYLSNLVDDLIAAAKDPKDMFEDIPLDTRHHKIVQKPKFPPAWRMTEERMKMLQEKRDQLAAADAEKAATGKLVDGQKAIDDFLARKALMMEQSRDKVAELVAAPAMSGGARKGGRQQALRR